MDDPSEPESAPGPVPAGPRADAPFEGPTPGGPAPAGPEPVTPRRSAMAVRLIAVAVTLVLAGVIAFVVVVLAGPPSVEELRTRAGLDDRRELLIGVKDDQPGVAEYDEGRKIWAGFDIDIAYMIAEDLGFRPSEVRFLSIESEDRARMQATDGDGRRATVDLVIASYSITPTREAVAGVTFSAPYLYTEQSVLTRKGHPKVSALDDLKDREVCTLSASTSQTAPKDAGAIVRRKNRMSECITDLRAGRVDAVSTDAAILAGFKARSPDEFEHWDLGLDNTEAWGINVGENQALKTLVNLTLYRSLKDPADDRWEVA